MIHGASGKFMAGGIDGTEPCPTTYGKPPQDLVALTKPLTTYHWMIHNPLIPLVPVYHTNDFIYTYNTPTWDWREASANNLGGRHKQVGMAPCVLELKLKEGQLVWPLAVGDDEYNQATYGAMGDVGQEIIVPPATWELLGVWEATKRLPRAEEIQGVLARIVDSLWEILPHADRLEDEFKVEVSQLEGEWLQVAVKLASPSATVVATREGGILADHEQRKQLAKLVNDTLLETYRDYLTIPLDKSGSHMLNVIAATTSEVLEVLVPRRSFTKVTLQCNSQHAPWKKPRETSSYTLFDGTPRLQPDDADLAGVSLRF